MKKVVFAILLTFLSFYGFSQERWDKNAVVKTNILNLFVVRPSIALDIPVTIKIVKFDPEKGVISSTFEFTLSKSGCKTIQNYE